MVVAAKLRQTGYDVIATEDGARAIEQIRVHKPDLILLDYFMPGMMGDAVCRAVKGDAELKHIPIILISASMAALTPEAIRAIACESHMSKPFDIKALLEKIRLFLEKSRAFKQNRHAPDYLTGKKRIPRRLPDRITMG